MLAFVKQFRWFITLFTVLVASQAFGHGMSEEEKQIIIEGGNLRYIYIGMTHMLSGYDHLLFVFGIIFFLTGFRDIVKYISAFTIGHSITLIWATFNAIQVNYFLIDAVIALSVCYIAFQNLDGLKKYFNVEAPNMLAMIFGLGLIHGLGLSTRLQQLPLNEDQLLLNIISFNIGIEVGQVLALALMLLLMTLLRKRKTFSAISKIANVTLVFAGCLLFLMQLHGYQHTANGSELSSAGDGGARAQQTPISTQSEWQDSIVITLPARGEKEYKLLMEEGETFQYDWKTSKGKLFYDFHGEPSAGKKGSFQSFQKKTADSAGGELTTAFVGTHGWYWKNNNPFAVTISLKLSGDYTRLDMDTEPESSQRDTLL